MPADADIDQCLRRVVRDAIANDEDITVNKARVLAETELGLDPGFFKETPAWKNRSKEIINAAVEEPDSPVAVKKASPRVRLAAKSETTGRSADNKRTIGGKKNKKNNRIADSDEEVSGPDLDDDEEEEIKPKPAATSNRKRKSDENKPPRRAKKKAKVESDEDMPEVEAATAAEEEPDVAVTNGSHAKAAIDEDDGHAASDQDVKPAIPHADHNNAKHEDEESDFSSVIDDPPPKKKRGPRNSAPGTSKKQTKTNPEKAAKPKSASNKDHRNSIGPDEEEIKRLQSWLLKCGVRKLWHRELAGCTTPRDKIRHLKGMLADVGLTGRFSAEKARQIKEARELAAELEAAQDFESKWGHGAGENDDDNDDDDDDDGEEEQKKDEDENDSDMAGSEEAERAGAKRPPRRTLPKGFVDFGDSGEESD